MLDLYVDGAIDRGERDARLAALDAEIAAVTSALSREGATGGLSVGRLLEAFAPFREFEYLRIADKRRLLSALAPEISVAGYSVIGLSVALPRGDDFSLTAKASLITAERLYLPLGIDLGGPQFDRKPPTTKWEMGSGEPRTYGDHVRARRLQLGLFRREAADLIGVDETTIYNWESNRNAPTERVIPQLIKFLGYRP